MASKKSIANAYVQVIPTTEGIKGKLTDIFDKDSDEAGKKSGESFGKKFVATATKIIGALGIAKLFGDAIKAGGEVEQSFGGLQTMFKDNYEQIAKYANEAWKNVGISANSYAEQVTSFSAAMLKSVGGDTAKAVEMSNMAMMDMADNANKFGTNIESIQNAYQGFAKQNYAMLDNLKLGYGGTASEMVRLIKDSGVLGEAGNQLTASNLNQMVSFAQMAEAIHITQERMGVLGTTALEGSTTLQGSFSQIKASWENLMGAFTGTTEQLDITEAVEGLVTGLSNYAQNIVPVLVSIVETLPQALIDIIDKMLPVMMQEAPKLIMSMADAIINNLPLLIQNGVELVAALIQGLMKMLPQLPVYTEKLVRAIWQGIAQINWTQLGKNVIDGIVQGLRNFGSAIKDMLVSLCRSAFNSVKSFFGIHSPSRLMRDEIGKYIPLGMAVGIEANADSVVDAMDEMSGLAFDSVEAGIVTPISSGALLSGNSTTNMGGIVINVNAAEGQNAREIAEEVSDILMSQVEKNRMVFA